MNECPNEMLLSAFFDGELPPAEQLRVANHLEACSDCRTSLQWFTRLSGRLAEFDVPALPARSLHRMRRVVAWHADAALLRFARGIAAAAAVIVLSCSAWLVASPATQHPVAQPAVVATAPPAVEAFESSGPESIVDPDDEIDDSGMPEWVADDLAATEAP